MKTRIAAALAAVLLGAAPVTSASAAPYFGRSAPEDVAVTGSIGTPFAPDWSRDPRFCAPSSAAEGNANQQNFPVKQYGQTAGGNRC